MASRKITGFSEAGFPIYDDEVVEPYIYLARAILRQAKKDYIETYRLMLRAKSDDKVRELQERKDELEEFFYSDWFDTISLSTADPGRFITGLRKTAIEQEKELYRKRMERLV